MNHQLFSHVISDYYTRHYELAPSLTSGLQVTIYAECSPNNSGVNGHFYALELYFSANEFPVRDYHRHNFWRKSDGKKSDRCRN